MAEIETSERWGRSPENFFEGGVVAEFSKKNLRGGCNLNFTEDEGGLNCEKFVFPYVFFKI